MSSRCYYTIPDNLDKRRLSLYTCVEGDYEKCRSDNLLFIIIQNVLFNMGIREKNFLEDTITVLGASNELM